jgi:hypothetical protein
MDVSPGSTVPAFQRHVSILWKTVLNRVGALDATRIVGSYTEWHLTLTGVTRKCSDSVFFTCHDIPARFTFALNVLLTYVLPEAAE